jgi:hypothetical protein
MKHKAETIEDLLEMLAGMRTGAKIDIESSDATIMYSIARQAFKGTPLTDRQFALMQEKLQAYKPQFLLYKQDFDNAVQTLRQPLRQIDRSKYIKIVDNAVVYQNVPYERYKESWNWIKVRFPFSKKLIVDLQSIVCPHNEKLHEKGSHEHFFMLNEKNAYNIVKTFKDKNFEIDQELIDYYEKVAALQETNHLPCVENMQLKNLHPNGVKSIEEELGKLSSDNVVLYKDRSLLYGIHSFDNSFADSLTNYSTLTQKIVNRENANIFIDKKSWTLDNIVQSINDLERYPLVILLDEDMPFDTLVQTHKHFKNIIPAEQISVLFRLESSKSNGFNEYIKEQELNSPIDNNTKIVYISREKINKPLLKSNCNPRTMLMLQSQRVHTKLSYWSEDFDLIIHYDDEVSTMMKYTRKLDIL